MSLARFRASNHPQQVNAHGELDSIDDRATTWEVFTPLDKRFVFTLDAAASEANTKLERYYDKAADGLAQSWAGERVWCNPPYSRIRPWVEKAWEETPACDLIVMLLPANRTEQDWWQDLVEPYRLAGSLRVEFLRGRMRFFGPGRRTIGANERPPFGVCLVIWDRFYLSRNDQRPDLEHLFTPGPHGLLGASDE